MESKLRVSFHSFALAQDQLYFYFFEYLFIEVSELQVIEAKTSNKDIAIVHFFPKQ